MFLSRKGIRAAGIAVFLSSQSAWAQDTQIWGALAAYAAGNDNACYTGTGAAWNYPTHWEATWAAMSQCQQMNVHCQDATVFEGRGMCGAVATAAWNGSDGTARCAFGSGHGETRAGAESAAMSSCQSTGAEGCAVASSACND